MDQFPFYLLPREIRDMITQYALTTQHGVIPIYAGRRIMHSETWCSHWNPRVNFKQARHRRPCIHDVLDGWPSACKQSREECGNLVLSLSRIEFLYYNDTTTYFKTAQLAKRALGLLGPNTHAIRHIRLASVIERTDELILKHLVGKWKMLKDIKRLLHPDARVELGICFSFPDYLRDERYRSDFKLNLPVGDSDRICEEIHKCVEALIAEKSQGYSDPATLQWIHDKWWQYGNAMNRFIEGLGD